MSSTPSRQILAEMGTSSGAVLQVFSTGTKVQVFELDEGLSAEAWNASADAVPGHLP